MTDSLVSDEMVMDEQVRRASAALADGAVAAQVLQDLWRAAYATGVRKYAGYRDYQLAQAEKFGGSRGALARVRGDGWVYASSVMHARDYGDSGRRFRYGGQDPASPAVDRPAHALSHRGALRLNLADTGEDVPWPAGNFWARPEDGEAGGWEEAAAR